MTFPGVSVFLVTFLTSFSQGLYLGLGVEEPAQLVLLGGFMIIWSIGWWMFTDLPRRGIRLIYCLGLFLLTIGIILAPYYLFKTRGSVRALITIGIFLVYYVGAFVTGVFTGFLFNPSQFY